ncbi:tripartite ATP-independent periplasmic transporter DctQ [Vibrio sinaloensis DSM 21326]|uniref:TRAP transporter small permease protein n=1 Tax=Vibrio sinaloensis DSM 21326 TaxID=945550 RepID=E8MCQ3_PHOS4|nr:TRAP transporter small permease [Vibrio sinaloensis]EGA68079.1 tripartite ATP-independent periplasmic transporter DctQ [Vibrio sinaloensis DSM 21326]
MLSKLLATYCLGINRLVYWVGVSASVLMPILAATVAFEVFSRYVLGKPTIWAYDVSLFLFGYIAALGGALAQQNKAHINVDVLYLSVSMRVRSLFNLASYSLAIFFLSVVAMMALGKFEEAIEFNYRRQSEWAPSMAHFWVMMMVACTAFIVQFTSDMIQDLYYVVTGKALIEPENEQQESADNFVEQAGDA